MRRETQNILLVLLGGALLKIAITGSYTRYVKPSTQWYLIVAGAVMLILAAVAIVRDLRQRSAEAAAEVHDDHGHAHDREPRSPWLLLLPVLAIFLIAPPALGSNAVDAGTGANTQKQASSPMFEKLPDGDVIPLRMTDFITRAVWDESGSVNDRKVKLTGFVVRDDAGATYVARLAISCCAADAMPVKVKMDGSGFDGLKKDQWVEVTGKVQPKTANENNGYVPSFTVAKITTIPQPADPYES